MNAREVLEAERKSCHSCWRKFPRACPIHEGVLHGIELAERADLERVETALVVSFATDTIWDGAPIGTVRAAIAAIRAAFPEVKEGE